MTEQVASEDSYFKIIDSNIDVTDIVSTLEQNPDDWHYIGLWSSSDSSTTSPYGIIPLVVAATPEPGVNIHDSHLLYNTSYYHKYQIVRDWVTSRGYQYLARCGFLALGPGNATELKQDSGKYHENKDRYYLNLKGRGLFTIHGKEFTIEPGTLFWFNHKEQYADMTTDDEEKWVFMFDVPRVEQPRADVQPPTDNRGESGEEAVS